MGELGEMGEFCLRTEEKIVNGMLMGDIVAQRCNAASFNLHRGSAAYRPAYLPWEAVAAG